MKRVFTLALSVLLIVSASSLSGCKAPHVWAVGNKESTAYALETYAAACEAMKELTYAVKTDGTTKVKAPLMKSELKVYGTHKHKPGEVYFENVSVGNKVLGLINTSYARRVYFNKEADSYRFSQTEGNDNISSNGSVAAWGGAQDIDEAGFADRFGRSIGQFSNYTIGADTVTENSLGLTDNGDGSATLHFVLDTSNGIASESVKGYVKQVHTMSGMDCSDFVSVEVCFVVDENYRILSCHVEEEYEVKAMMGIKAQTNNTLDYTVTYYDTPQEMRIASF